MSKKSLLVAGLLVFMTTGERDAPAQSCKADRDDKIYNAIQQKYGPHPEQPTFEFIKYAEVPNLDGLRNLGKDRGGPGFQIDRPGNPLRDLDLVSHLYAVQQGKRAWRLYISTVDKFAVLKEQRGEVYSAPLVGQPGGPSEEIINWLRSNGYRVLGEDTLKCLTGYTMLKREYVVIRRRRPNYWDMLFRIETKPPQVAAAVRLPGRPFPGTTL